MSRKSVAGAIVSSSATFRLATVRETRPWVKDITDGAARDLAAAPLARSIEVFIRAQASGADQRASFEATGLIPVHLNSGRRGGGSLDGSLDERLYPDPDVVCAHRPVEQRGEEHAPDRLGPALRGSRLAIIPRGALGKPWLSSPALNPD